MSDIAEAIGAAMLDHFSGDRDNNDDFLQIVGPDGEVKLEIQIPDVVVASISDALRSHRLEMLPEMILHRSFTSKRPKSGDDDGYKGDRIVLVSKSKEAGDIHDEVDPGRAISGVAYKWLMKTLRKGRIAQQES